MHRPFLFAALGALALAAPAIAQEALKVGPIIERTFKAPPAGGNPADCYPLNLATGQAVTVSVAAAGLKPALTLMGPGCKGETLARSVARESLVRMEVTGEPRVASIRVESAGGQPGAYALQVKATPARLTIGQTVQGRFDAVEVCYRIQPQGLWMVTTLTGDADAKLTIHANPDCGGAPVAGDTDDAAGGGTDARAVYRAVIMRDHSVKVARWGTAPGRAYSLTVRTQMQPPPN
jgi:hypothetical protein